MSLKELNKPVKGTLNWDEPLNENFDSITEYAAEVDEKLAKAADKDHTHNPQYNYGECSTDSNVEEKAVTIIGFGLVAGAKVTVKFTKTNTASEPKLNISGTGAKDIYYRGTKITNETPTLQANGIYDFVYNGTAFDIIGSFGGGYGC